MTPRLVFLAERQSGIGGSDIASLFNIGYGCQLRLWRQKRGEVPDFPQRDTPPMKLGRLMEAFFVREYTSLTGRRVHKHGIHRHPEHPWAMVHVDRVISDPGAHGSDLGTLEVKAMGREMFFKVKREGMAPDHVLQLQHGMMVHGHEWGEFAIGYRDMGDLLPPFRMAHDRSITDQIVQAGPSFWKQVQEGPAPALLSPDDPRCQRCEYRRSCQGAALMEASSGDKAEVDESLRPLRQEYLERRAAVTEAEDALAATREELSAALGSRTLVQVAGKNIHFKSQTSYRWAGDDLAQALSRSRCKVDLDGTVIPGDLVRISKEFKKGSVSRPLRVY
jgi:predicted phage-related endonuclease